MADDQPGFHYDVSEEQRRTFAALSPAKRLRWLDEMRDWTWQASSAETRASWLRLRERRLTLETGLWSGEHPWRRGDAIRGWIGGMHPVVGRGWVDGREWDFRAMDDEWSLTIAENPADRADRVGSGAPGWMVQGIYGAGVDGSGMPEADAWTLVIDSIRKYRARELRWMSPGELLPG
jgi:hypothetical protein